MYSTKVIIESNISLSQMKWETSNNCFEALKYQHIFLKEWKDGPMVQTGNAGWLEGLNPNQYKQSKR